MATPRGVSPERLKLILERQKQGLFGKQYTPSILATRNEAPSISRPSILSSISLGRDIHLLSQPERFAALVALHHPNLVDLHEQKMLPMGPSQHPLASHPHMVGKSLPSMRGTVAVAEALGYLKFHPTVSVPDPRMPDASMWVPYPYVGDLLIFMNMNDRHYCVNWTIKKTFDDFSRGIPTGRRRGHSVKEKEKAIARHQIEEANYLDADIRTVQFTEDTVDLVVINNLHKLFGYSKAKLEINGEQRQEILDKFKSGMVLGIPGNEVVQMLINQTRFTIHDCLTVFNQAIWSRELRVDLFSPILINRPIRPEVRDVLEVYSNLFQE